MGDNIAQQNNLHVFTGVLHRFITTPKEVKDRIEEYHRYDRKCQSQHDIQHQYITQDTLGCIVIFLSQFNRYQCGSSNSYQRTECSSKIHQGKSKC